MANPILEHLRLSGTTYDLVDSSAIHSMEGYWDSATTQNAITAATNALAETVAEEMSGKTDVSAFTSYTSSTESALSGKADTTSVTQAIDAAVSGKADTTAVTQSISEATSGKADTTAVTQAISEAVSGKLDTSTFATYSGNVDTALASKIAGAAWDSTTSHLNFFDNVSATGTPLTYVDGADWVKDSFLKSVTIENREISGETVPCLVFVFETESGETETVIPLSNIFDPTNYVSLATYTAYTAATSTEIGNKVDTSAMTQAIDAATSGKVDTTTYTAYTAATDTVLSGKQDTLTPGAGIAIDTANTISVTGIPLTVDDTVTSGSSNPVKSSGIYGFVTGETATKQDTLVSGTNIKTINSTSILGSGNITTLQAEVQGTTLILS